MPLMRFRYGDGADNTVEENSSIFTLAISVLHKSTYLLTYLLTSP